MRRNNYNQRRNNIRDNKIRSAKSRNRRRNKNKRIIVLIMALILVISGVSIFVHSRSKSKGINAAAKEEQIKEENNNNNEKAQANKEKAANEEKKAQNEVDKGQNIISSAESYAVPANEVAQMIAGNSKNNNKEIFLTFDDGPSPNTSKILKILKEKGVHATFFVMGNNLKDNKKNQQLLKDEFESGNAIANHTLTHDYKKLYPNNRVNVPYFMKEVKDLNKMMENILGSNFDCRVLRMPGGYMSRRYYKDEGLPSLNKNLDENHITSIDWNASIGDGSSKHYTTKEIIANSARYMKEQKHMILLMHDSGAKVETVKALPKLIDFYKEKGYSFKVIKNAPIDSFKDLNTNSTKTDSNQGQKDK